MIVNVAVNKDILIIILIVKVNKLYFLLIFKDSNYLF